MVEVQVLMAVEFFYGVKLKNRIPYLIIRYFHSVPMLN